MFAGAGSEDESIEPTEARLASRAFACDAEEEGGNGQLSGEILAHQQITYIRITPG
jgi:hypothetical protein